MTDIRMQPNILRSRAFANAEQLAHGFSTRCGGVSRVYRPELSVGDGDLNLGYTEQDDAEHVRENRRRFLEALDAPELDRFALMRQVHSDTVHIVDSDTTSADEFTRPGTLQGDGLMTDRPGVLLAIGTADCMPILLFDPVRRVVAAFHAGWRGTLARIVEHGVGTMRQRYGSHPEDLHAAIGPGIGPASYAVSIDLQEMFAAQFGYVEELFHTAHVHEKAVPQLHLNLWQANRRQLLDAGIGAENIDLLAADTAANTDRFFSHRAENGRTGRMLSVIGLTA